jgi:transposase
VIDHDSGRLVWAHPGRDKQTVYKFLDPLGADRCEQIALVSCDMADWITIPIGERCANAEICLDPFHVIKLSTDARWTRSAARSRTTPARPASPGSHASSRAPGLRCG